MAFLEKQPTKFDSLWEFKSDKLSIPSVGSKVIAWTPRVNEPPVSLINKGITHISFNDGQSAGQINHPGRAIFVGNPEFLKSYGQPLGKRLSQFTEQDCKNAVLNMWNAKTDNGQFPMTCVTTGSSENNKDNVEWAQITYTDPDHPNRLNATNQYHWIDREWSRLCRLAGGEYYGDYDGFQGIASSTGIEGQFNRNGLSGQAFRNSFLSNQAAYDRIKSAAPAGGGNPYFTQDAFQYRSGLIRTYWDASVDGSERLFEIIFGATFGKMALAHHNNTTSKFLSFGWAGRNEFYSRLEHYKTTLFDGSQAQDLRFPCWSFRMHEALGYLSMALMDGIFLWEDTQLHGTNPNKVSTINPVDPQYTYNGSASNTVSPINIYTPNVTAPYPQSFDVGHNYMLEGCAMFGHARTWAGEAVSYVPYRTVGGTFSNVGRDYMLDVYLQSKPFGLIHKQGGRRMLFALDMHRAPGTYQEYEFNCDGEILRINMEGQRPYFMFGEV